MCPETCRRIYTHVTTGAYDGILSNRSQPRRRSITVTCVVLGAGLACQSLLQASLRHVSTFCCTSHLQIGGCTRGHSFAQRRDSQPAVVVLRCAVLSSSQTAAPSGGYKQPLTSCHACRWQLTTRRMQCPTTGTHWAFLWGSSL